MLRVYSLSQLLVLKPAEDWTRHLSLGGVPWSFAECFEWVPILVCRQGCVSRPDCCCFGLCLYAHALCRMIPNCVVNKLYDGQIAKCFWVLWWIPWVCFPISLDRIGEAICAITPATKQRFVHSRRIFNVIGRLFVRLSPSERLDFFW